MKKTAIFAIIIAMVAVFTACKNDLEPFKPVGMGVVVQTDSVTYVVEEPILSPRYSCSGKVLDHPKYLGSRFNQVVIPGRSKRVSDSILNSQGYVYTGNRVTAPSNDKDSVKSESNHMPASSLLGSVSDAIWDWVKVIGYIVILSLLLWFLSHIVKWLWNNRPRFQRDEKVSDQNFVGVVNLSDTDREKIVTETKNAVTKDLENLNSDKLYYNHIEEITKILQKTGGKLDSMVADNCRFIIEIPSPSKNEAGTEK